MLRLSSVAGSLAILHVHFQEVKDDGCMRNDIGCPECHCAKVWAYCSASNHLTHKMSSGMFQESSSRYTVS